MSNGDIKYMVSVEPGNTMSVCWVTEEDLSDGLYLDNIEFTVEILADVELESGIYNAENVIEIDILQKRESSVLY